MEEKMNKILEKLTAGETLDRDQQRVLCRSLMTTEARMEKLILSHFDEQDYLHILRHRIGDGCIGGKACGVLVARKIIKEKLPEYGKYLLPHHSWFLGSGLYCDYLEENDCVKLREEQRQEKGENLHRRELEERLLRGRFSLKMEKNLRELLQCLPPDPYVVRSSSFLEDGFGNAFSGKYESVFCVNQGSEEERLEELKEAIRRVYASTQNVSALEYRRTRGLWDVEEQMAILVQRVEGRRWGDYYFPLAAGMGCSYNPYKWMEEMVPEAGMLRVVAGLGTRAVERTPGDYPRLIGLDRPKANRYLTVAERHKFSQRWLDGLCLSRKKCESLAVEELLPHLTKKERQLLFSRDTEAEDRLRECGRYRDVFFADCEGVAHKDEFIHGIQEILKVLEQEYGCPVDVEFALESGDGGWLTMNLYQCRPMQQMISQEIEFPKGVDQEILFDVRRTSMKRSKEERIDLIVWVSPQKYYEYPYHKKPDVSRVIGEINHYFGEQNKKMLLLVPGRIGTSSPELGVPVTYADVSRFAAICEVAYSKAGYNPALSYGSHMFQDLVEADVYYGAINENSKTRLYQPDLLEEFPELFHKLWKEREELWDIVKIYDVSQGTARLLLDAREGRAVCHLKKEK